MTTKQKRLKKLILDIELALDDFNLLPEDLTVAQLLSELDEEANQKD